MKLLLTFMLSVFFGQVFGQVFSYQNINKSSNSISNFIPEKWKLLDSAKGDLNGDKNDDFAIVLQYKDSVSIEKVEFKEKDTIITQPRILVLAFYNPSLKVYELNEQSNSFILNHDAPNMEDPYENISISKGVLKIEFTIFSNLGGWGMSNNSYKFRFQDKEFKLIGADYNYTNRGNGEIENRSYNFLTKKVNITTGNLSKSKNKTIIRLFKFDKLKTFETFVKPFTWEIEKNFTI